MRKVSQLERATLVVDEKLDMIIEHLKKQEAHAARIELRLAEYSDYITEVGVSCLGSIGHLDA